ncbi:MAG: hypothetical protein Q4P24_09050 [Rhodobacterales bacterium]|nr:hypothetical protein [Rhodobacterales bacterium]
MTAEPPRIWPKLVALISSLAVVAIAVFALWNYLGGSDGDDPPTRISVIDPVADAVAAAAAHSDRCIRVLSDGAHADTARDTDIAATATCGSVARDLAAAGYAALDAATGPKDSARRAEFLDSAGALLSVYEMQGDDFDMAHDMLESAHENEAEPESLSTEIDEILARAATDITVAQEQLERTQAAYQSGG